MPGAQGAGCERAAGGESGLEPGRDNARARRCAPKGLSAFPAWARTRHRCRKKPSGRWLSHSSSRSCPGRAPHLRRSGQGAAPVWWLWAGTGTGTTSGCHPACRDEPRAPSRAAAKPVQLSRYIGKDKKIRSLLRSAGEARELRALPCARAGRHLEQPQPSGTERWQFCAWICCIPAKQLFLQPGSAPSCVLRHH